MQIATFAEKKCISLKHILALPMLGQKLLNRRLSCANWEK